MRTRIVCLLMAFLPFALAAEEYSVSEVFVEGTCWNTGWAGIVQKPDGSLETSRSEQYMLLEGEEEVNGYKAMKLWKVSGENPEDKQFFTFIRTEGEKVYFLEDKSRDDWGLLYDFEPLYGQPCTYSTLDWRGHREETLPMVYIGSLSGYHSYNEQGLETMRFLFSLDFDPEAEYGPEYGETIGLYHMEWVKGVGSVYGLFDFFFTVGFTSTLSKVWNGDKVFYDITRPTEIATTESGKPVITVIGKTGSITGVPEGATVEAYSADGRAVARVYGSCDRTSVAFPGAGVYVIRIDGRSYKVLVR